MHVGRTSSIGFIDYLRLDVRTQEVSQVVVALSRNQITIWENRLVWNHRVLLGLQSMITLFFLNGRRASSDYKTSYKIFSTLPSKIRFWIWYWGWYTFTYSVRLYTERHQQKERTHSQMAHCENFPVLLLCHTASIRMEVFTCTANSMNKICKSYELIEEATRFHRTCIASQKPPENSDSPLTGWLSDCCCHAETRSRSIVNAKKLRERKKGSKIDWKCSL